MDVGRSSGVRRWRRGGSQCTPSVAGTVLVLLGVAFALQPSWGCGAETPSGTGATVSVSVGTSAGQPDTEGATERGGLMLEGWGQPSQEVRSAFADHADTLDCPLYVPTLVPVGTRVASDPTDPAADEELGAQLAVSLAVDGGIIHVWEGVEGDIGDAAGESCGEVDGRPAVAYPMLGGVVVQWSDRGWWYGVFSRDLSREGVVRLATAMKTEEKSAP